MRTTLRLLRFVLVLVCAMVANSLFAQTRLKEPVGDSLRVSLLTCEPGLEAYERFGHTALRVIDAVNEQDWVFNYGTFSFEEPNFIWRFMMGEGSYFLDVMPYAIFEEHYLYEGRSITEQCIRLLPEERLSLYYALVENLRPENVRYRYNFLYDNCTTRAVRQIENAAGQVVYALPDDAKGKTFRTIIHEATEKAPWSQFGIDLLLGEEVDRPINTEQYFFSPLYAQRLMATGKRVGVHGVPENLVEQTVFVPAEATTEMLADHPSPFTPLMAMALLLVLVFAMSVLSWKRKRMFALVDVSLLLTQAVEGSIIALLFFCSAHPAVGSNWLVVWLNPLPFVGLLLRYAGRRTPLRSYYHPFSAILLSISLLAMPFLPQEFPLPVYLFASALLLHSLTAVLVEGKPTLHNKNL